MLKKSRANRIIAAGLGSENRAKRQAALLMIESYAELPQFNAEKHIIAPLSDTDENFTTEEKFAILSTILDKKLPAHTKEVIETKLGEYREELLEKQASQARRQGVPDRPERMSEAHPKAAENIDNLSSLITDSQFGKGFTENPEGEALDRMHKDLAKYQEAKQHFSAKTEQQYTLMARIEQFHKDFYSDIEFELKNRNDALKKMYNNVNKYKKEKELLGPETKKLYTKMSQLETIHDIFFDTYNRPKTLEAKLQNVDLYRNTMKSLGLTERDNTGTRPPIFKLNDSNPQQDQQMEAAVNIQSHFQHITDLIKTAQASKKDTKTAFDRTRREAIVKYVSTMLQNSTMLDKDKKIVNKYIHDVIRKRIKEEYKDSIDLKRSVKEHLSDWFNKNNRSKAEEALANSGIDLSLLMKHIPNKKDVSTKNPALDVKTRTKVNPRHTR